MNWSFVTNIEMKKNESVWLSNFYRSSVNCTSAAQILRFSVTTGRLQTFHSPNQMHVGDCLLQEQNISTDTFLSIVFCFEGEQLRILLNRAPNIWNGNYCRPCLEGWLWVNLGSTRPWYCPRLRSNSVKTVTWQIERQFSVPNKQVFFFLQCTIG